MGMQQQAFDCQPIVATCTPQGLGAVCMIRISGTSSIALLANFTELPSKQKIEGSSGNVFKFAVIKDKNVVVDEVIVAFFKAPRSFTGQETVEITCHNNPLIINNIITLAIQFGARPASPGEFCKRAVLNKKIDLTQAEAVHDVIMANNEESLKRSLSQLQGSLSQFLDNLCTGIIGLLATVESALEFMEEEQMDLDFENLVKNKFEEQERKIKLLLESAKNKEKITRGVKITLAGPVNAGKSTLFNALLEKDRAIVSNKPGTTRDSIDALLTKNKQLWSIFDTAGIRKKSTCEIEQEGIRRSNLHLIDSDLILLIFDVTAEIDKNEHSHFLQLWKKYKHRTIVVFNKIDMLSDSKKAQVQWLKEIQTQAIKISAQQKNGLKELENKISEKITAVLNDKQSPFLLTHRQSLLIKRASISLEEAKQVLLKNHGYEVVSIHLRQMLKELSEISGKTADRKVMDNLFSSFCIGK
jgi:tRNA modification GTPase